MAKMIPSHSHFKSRAEKEIFFRLQEDEGTKDWIVLHSLDLADNVKKLAGEIDFVIIVPGKGVLCLEVKGCTRLKRLNGSWYYGTDPNGDVLGPFKQASEGMHSLRNSLPQSFSSILFYSSVIFPYIPFTEKSPEWHSWQVLDQGDFRKPISENISKVLDSARAHVVSKPNGMWFNPNNGEPTEAQSQQLAKVMRPDFEHFQSPKTLAHQVTAELVKYTEEQFVCLDHMSLNKRVAFIGPAGTGKTLLAIEATRRSLQEGTKTRVLCFNRLLGEWMTDQLSSLGPSVITGTINQFLLELAGNIAPPPNAGPEFWENKLPSLALESLLQNEDDDYSVDELVIDEAQDLLKPQYLEVLDYTLKGGLSAGKWKLFGDFSNQAIFKQNMISLENFIGELGGNAVVCSLSINCRNTPLTVQTIQTYLDISYSKVLRPDNEMDCRMFFYADDSEQEKLLATQLEKARTSFQGQDIIVLSPRVPPACAASKISSLPWKQSLAPLGSATGGQIPYHSIQGFKGLERPAVIITDINEFDTEEAKSLLYVGLTRGTASVTALASNQVQEDLKQFILSNMAPNNN